MAELAPGLNGQVETIVGEGDLARALGSGDVPVLGTPRMIALAEAATVAALAGTLEQGRTSVGTRVDMRQIGPRDEARMLGGLGHCGEELCCARLGGEFQPVSLVFQMGPVEHARNLFVQPYADSILPAWALWLTGTTYCAASASVTRRRASPPI